jgi:hypothetical protein
MKGSFMRKSKQFDLLWRRTFPKTLYGQEIIPEGSDYLPLRQRFWELSVALWQSLFFNDPQEQELRTVIEAFKNSLSNSGDLRKEVVGRGEDDEEDFLVDRILGCKKEARAFFKAHDLDELYSSNALLVFLPPIRRPPGDEDIYSILFAILGLIIIDEAVSSLNDGHVDSAAVELSEATLAWVLSCRPIDFIDKEAIEKEILSRRGKMMSAIRHKPNREASVGRLICMKRSAGRP